MAGFFSQLGVRVEAEYTQAIVHAHYHHAFRGQHFAVLPRLGSGAGLKPAAVNPHHYRKPVVRGFGGRPDVEIQAVLAHSRVLEYHVPVNICLHAVRAEMVRFMHAGPGRDRLWRLPTRIAHRRRGVRNAQKNADGILSSGPLHYAAG